MREQVIAGKNPVFITTKAGLISVYGHEHVSKNEILILGYCINMLDRFGITVEDHGIRSVIFRQEDPYNELATCCPVAKAIVINLQEHFMTALKQVRNTDENSSILTVWHRILITTFLHEIYHIVTRQDFPDVIDEETKELMEEQAEEFALKSREILGLEQDIEPGLFSEIRYLSSAWHKVVAAVNADENDEAGKKFIEWQNHMLENRIFFNFPAVPGKHSELILCSFRHYLCLISKDKDNPAWKAPAINTDTGTKVAFVEKTTPVEAFANTNNFEAQGRDPKNIEAAPWLVDEVPFMEEVHIEPAEDTSAFTGSFQTSVPPVEEEQVVIDTPATYAPNGMTPIMVKEIMTSVYRKVYNKIFGACQPQSNSDVGFAKPEAVMFEPIELTDDEKKVVVGIDAMDNNGVMWKNIELPSGMLYGMVMSKTKLPAYKLYLNVNGEQHIRLLLPQNPAKRESDGNYTKTAAMARSGQAIMYIMDGKEGANQYFFKFVNGNMMAC